MVSGAYVGNVSNAVQSVGSERLCVSSRESTPSEESSSSNDLHYEKTKTKKVSLEGQEVTWMMKMMALSK